MVLACNYQKTVVSWCFSQNLGNVHFLYTVEWEVTCLVFFCFRGGSFDSTQNHRNLFFCWEAVPNFCWKPHQNVRMESSSFLVPEKLKALEKLQMETPQAFQSHELMTFLGRSACRCYCTSQSYEFHPCRKKAFKPLAWICVKIWLSWSFCTTSLFGPSMLHVISDLVSS